jgi:hypothetical protein
MTTSSVGTFSIPNIGRKQTPTNADERPEPYSPRALTEAVPIEQIMRAANPPCPLLVALLRKRFPAASAAAQ